MKIYIECWPEGQQGEYMKSTPSTELFACPGCGHAVLFGHCCGEDAWEGETRIPLVVKVFDHHGELKDSPPACQQVWEWLKSGRGVEKGDEIILPDNLDADSMLAWGLLEQSKEGFEPEDLDVLDGVVAEVAAADLGKGALSCPAALNVRKHVIAAKKMGKTAMHLVWLDGGDVEEFDEAWGYAQAVVDQQDRDSKPVLLDCGRGVAVLQRGNAKLVKASEAKVLLVPWMKEGVQHYSISSPNPGGVDLRPILALLEDSEPGWGGRAMSGGILGDPKPQGTKLTLVDIVRVCRMGQPGIQH